MNLIFTFLFLISFSSYGEDIQLFSVNNEISPYFQISKSTTKALSTDSDDSSVFLKALNAKSGLELSDLSKATMIVDGLIAIGKKIWPIIEAGRPVVNISSSDTLSVIPSGFEDLDILWDLEGWSTPVVKRYEVVYENAYGMEVVKLTYSVVYQYGASFEDKGKYLMGIKIIPDNIEVAWGYTLDADSVVISVSNHGKKNNPLAGATIGIIYSVSTVFKTIKKRDSFHILGNGNFSKL